jgi:hypothetical protein
MTALALAAFYINHRRECAICSRALLEPRSFDLRRCHRGHRLALGYILALRAERDWRVGSDHRKSAV